MDSVTPKLPPDYHTHNLLCKHAVDKPLAYAQVAARQGLPAMAATDHCPTDEGFGQGHRMALAQFDEYRARVEEARQNAGIPVLYGVEADYYRGCQRFLAPFLEREAFDVVLGSVHFLDYWAVPPAPKGLADGGDPAAIWARYFTLIGEMADTGLYDIATHLDLPKKFGNELPRHLLRDLALPALDRLAKAGMCIEINTSGRIHAPCAFYPAEDLLAWARERNIGLTFGSDAHKPERVGEGFAEAVEMARRAGYTERVEFLRRKATRVPL